MSTNHKTTEICHCKNCTKIDMLFGDPLLSPWEKTFIENLVRYGWISDYTVKQVAKLRQIWRKIHELRKIPLPTGP